MPSQSKQRMELDSPHAWLAIGCKSISTTGKPIQSRSPIDARELGVVNQATAHDVKRAVDAAAEAFKTWRLVPAPKRGEFVRRISSKLRERKSELGTIVSLEAGKITSEALGEVQEMIDICDFAVGLSRQLHGLTIASERPGHRMMEQWHPLGPVGVITAFNFPVAVWAWNAALALVCGDAVVWKPSEKTPLTAMATHALLERACRGIGDLPPHLSQVVLGGADEARALLDQPQVRLASATGSTRMGRAVAAQVAPRF